MKKYDNDIKATAIAILRKKGVKETSQELGISLQTLYKWRNEDKLFLHSHAETPTPKMEEMMRILRNDEIAELEMERLEAENLRLRKTITLIRKAILAMLE